MLTGSSWSASTENDIGGFGGESCKVLHEAFVFASRDLFGLPVVLTPFPSILDFYIQRSSVMNQT